MLGPPSDILLVVKGGVGQVDLQSTFVSLGIGKLYSLHRTHRKELRWILWSKIIGVET